MNLTLRISLPLAACIALAGCAETTDRQQSTGSQDSGDAGQPLQTLNSALAAGDVVLGSIRGNGSSSGAALNASLLNTTEGTLTLRTRLDPALYLRTASRSAQNMLATKIYGEGSRYQLVGEESVIELPAGTTPVVFHAYCVDFEKDNPSATDSFTIAEMPDWLAPLAIGAGDYEESRGNDETAMLRTQVALWLAQGEDPQAVRNTFRVSDADFEAAVSLDLAGR